MEKVAQQFIAFESNVADVKRGESIETPQVLPLELLEQIGGGDIEADAASLPARGW